MRIVIAPGMRSTLDKATCTELFDSIYYSNIPNQYIEAIEFTYSNGVVSFAELKDIQSMASGIDQEFLDRYANGPGVETVKIYINADKIHDEVNAIYDSIKPPFLND